MSSAGEDAEKLEFSHLLVQMVQNYVYTYKKVCKTGKIWISLTDCMNSNCLSSVL